MYLPKENLAPDKNGLMMLKELVLEWRMQFAVTQSSGNALCCVLYLIFSSDPLLVVVVWCAWHWRGAVCHRVTAPHLVTFCHLHVPAFSLVP